jgi:hypothetical protein
MPIWVFGRLIAEKNIQQENYEINIYWKKKELMSM